VIATPTRTHVTYTQALAKGGALLAETRILLEAWQPGEPAAAFTDRVLKTDVLGRLTATRTADILRVFSNRFLSPTDAPARHLHTLVSSETPGQMYKDLVFHYTAQHDDLLRDFTVDRYWPAVREGRVTISNPDVRNLILEAEQDGRIPSPWSAEIKRDMAGRVLIALTDFGLLRQLRPGLREVLPYRPDDRTVVYLAYRLHEFGATDSSLADQRPWALFGLEARDVWHRLEHVSDGDWFVIQRAGGLTRISWLYEDAEEVVHALAR
jgi:hypothetical protein